MFFQTPLKKVNSKSGELKMATESQNLPFACLPRLYFLLFAIVALHLSRVLYKSTLFMQNKPNLLDTQMNVGSVKTKDYENEPCLPAPRKQTQSNPISKAAPIIFSYNLLNQSDGEIESATLNCLHSAFR